MSDTCLNLSVIPQFRGTCWFNAILMIALYSQYVRNIMIKVSKKWDKSNSFLMILKAILSKYYNQPTKVQEFFNKIRPEIILFKMLKNTGNKEIIHHWKQVKKNNSYEWNSQEYIGTFFKYLNVNILDVIYAKGKYYVNSDNEFIIKNENNILRKVLKNRNDYLNVATTRKRINEVNKETDKILRDVPDIIILKHDKLYNPCIYVEFLEKTPNDPNFKVKGLDTYEDIITLNGHKYKLDAVTISNYNSGIGGIAGHSIAGITCNDNRYVYNGWTSLTDDPAKVNKVKNKSVSPCSLMKYNWNLRKDEGFCLNQVTCKLDNVNPKDLCFSFAKGNRALVYARIINKMEDDTSIPDKIKLSGVSDVIRDIHDVKNLTDEALKKKLKILTNNYTRNELEKLYYEKLKKNYKFNSTIDIKTPDKVVKGKALLKKDLIIAILAKYPDMKNLTTKTKIQLQAILNGTNNKKDELIKKPKLNTTKDELIKILKNKNPKLKGLAKLKKAELEELLKIGYS